MNYSDILILCDELFTGEFLTCCSEEALLSRYWIQTANKRDSNGPVLNASKPKGRGWGWF